MKIVKVLSFGLFIYCTIQFFDVEETNELIKWGAGGLMFLLMSTFIKILRWMQMDKNAILREMKGLELQITSIANKQV